MIIRILVIMGVAWYSLQHGYYYAAAFVLVGGFPFRAVAAIAGLPYNPFGWGFLVVGSGILYYNGEWIVGSIPLLWAFVWEIRGPKLFGMKSIIEELREIKNTERHLGMNGSDDHRKPGQRAILSNILIIAFY